MSRGRTLAGAATVALALCVPVPGLAQSGCDALDGTWGEPDLRCFDLVPTPQASGAAGGRVELRRGDGPFTVSVSPDGSHVWRLRVVLDRLPDPAIFGPYSSYVAWVTTPVLRPFLRLGVVERGVNEPGSAALDKFLVLVSAEVADTVSERRGPLVLRGTSPSMRLQPDHMPILLSEAARSRSSHPAAGGEMERADAQAGYGHDDHGRAEGAPRWPHPAMPLDVVMLPGMMPRPPEVAPFVPTPAHPDRRDGAPAPERRLANRASTELTAGAVTRTLHGRPYNGWSYDAASPGPLLRVRQGDTVQVRFRNRTDLPLTVHWHGLRLDNRFDGVPGLTQSAVAPGDAFDYELRFPDAGLFWYHPHHREDIAQDLGLYGNILVEPVTADPPNPVHHEVPLFVDDLLLTRDGSVMPHGLEHATHALMGRFGDVLLLNGREDWSMDVEQGAVARFLITNAANTRTFNLSFGMDSVKLVGGDVGDYVQERWVRNVPISPAERYVVEARYPAEGEYAITNRVRAIDHVLGAFVPRVDTMGVVRVGPGAARPDLSAQHASLERRPAVAADIDSFRAHFDRPPDRTVRLRLEADSLPFPLNRLMRLDSAYFHPVEWAGTMPMMNWILSADDVRWVLEDADTGQRNQDIDWSFDLGAVAKIRIVNERGSLHAMQHPIHLHGQRFLILEQDGERSRDLVWKDTILMPVGSWADILVDFSNPGRWMLHCHIAEHLEAGMKTVLQVGPAPSS